MDIYNLEWIDEEEQISVVCRFCNSIASIDPETGDEKCHVCKRINGNIDNRYAIIECKKCGWHIFTRGIEPIFKEHALECKRCYARFRVDKDGKPGGCLTVAEWCPTCRKHTVQSYEDEYKKLNWHCNHCKNTFHSDEHGSMILPDRCNICSHYSVQMQYDASSKSLYKQCTECNQLYNMNNEPLNNNSDDDGDVDIMQFSIRIASEKSNSLKIKGN